MKIYGMLKKLSLSTRNIIILIITLLPFILGLMISISKYDEMEYFGVAINVSGSQRMRTMLISNYCQQIENKDTNADSVQILKKEIAVYEKYMHALRYWDKSLALEANKYSEITGELDRLWPLYEDYVYHAKNIINSEETADSIEFITNNALELKNNMHNVVNLFQEQYDEEIRVQNIWDTFLLIFAIIFTLIGILFSKNKIGKKLIENENRYRSLFDQAPIGIINARIDGSLIDVNIQICKVLGYKKQEIMRLNFCDICHKDEVNDITMICKNYWLKISP